MKSVPSEVHQLLASAKVIPVAGPSGKGIPIVGAADELSQVLAVKPKGAVRGVACRKDGSTVFHAHPNHLRLAACGHLPFIPKRGRQHPCGGHLSCGAEGFTIDVHPCIADPFHGGVRGAVDTFSGASVVPIVAHNAVHDGCGSRVNGGVPGARVGWSVPKMVVPTCKPLVHHAPKTIPSKGAWRLGVAPRPKARQVVRAHLVHGDAHDQTWWRRRRGGADPNIGFERAPGGEHRQQNQSCVHRGAKIVRTLSRGINSSS